MHITYSVPIVESLKLLLTIIEAEKEQMAKSPIIPPFIKLPAISGLESQMIYIVGNRKIDSILKE